MPIQSLSSTSPEEQTVDEWLDEHAQGEQTFNTDTIAQADNRSNTPPDQQNKRTSQAWSDLKKAL